METTCELCLAIADAKSDNPKLHNTILYETRNFIVLPCLGQLIPGQILIVSKGHIPGLVTMNPTELDELGQLLEKVVSTNVYYKDSLFIEHGATKFYGGVNCIEHAHLHVYPNLIHKQNLLEGYLPISSTLNNYRDLNTIQFPYVLVHAPGKDIRIYNAFNVQSQLARKLLAKELDLIEWNWKNIYNPDNITQTINFWRE